VFRLILLETLTVLPYYFRDNKGFALFNLENPTLLAFSFRDPKFFALFNLETLISWPKI